VAAAPMLDKVLNNHSRERDPEFTDRLVRIFLACIVYFVVQNSGVCVRQSGK
jgi:hypothetical protein